MRINSLIIGLSTCATLLNVTCRSKNEGGIHVMRESSIVSIQPIDSTRLELSPRSVIGSVVEMAIDGKGNMLIADALDGTVKIFDKRGRYITSLERKSGRPLVITGMTLDGDDYVYVSDLPSSSVFRFARNGTLIDSTTVDEQSRFILGIPRVWKDKLYIGVLEKQFSTMDFYRSTLVGIFRKSNGSLIRRFGSFDEIYQEFVPLSPEVHFDISADGRIYIVQCHSEKVFCYDAAGNQLTQFGSESRSFRKPSSPMPRSTVEHREWLASWSNTNYVRATRKFILVHYFDRHKTDGKAFREDFFIDIYQPDGKLVESGVGLPGRLLYADDLAMYIGTDLTSPQKVITKYSLLLHE